jgi:hypothetical protein
MHDFCEFCSGILIGERAHISGVCDECHAEGLDKAQ